MWNNKYSNRIIYWWFIIENRAKDNIDKFITDAFSVAGDYVLVVQLAYVVVVGKEVVLIYIITMLISGIVAIALALYITRNDN